MNDPSMWILAFVIVPLIVLAGLAIIIVLSDREARKHDAENPPLYHE